MSEAFKRACGVGFIVMCTAFAGCTCSSADDWAQTSPVIKAEPVAQSAESSQTALKLEPAGENVARQ